MGVSRASIVSGALRLSDGWGEAWCLSPPYSIVLSVPRCVLSSGVSMARWWFQSMEESRICVWHVTASSPSWLKRAAVPCSSPRMTGKSHCPLGTRRCPCPSVWIPAISGAPVYPVGEKYIPVQGVLTEVILEWRKTANSNNFYLFLKIMLFIYLELSAIFFPPVIIKTAC